MDDRVEELRTPFLPEKEVTKPVYQRGKKTGEVTAVPWHEYVSRLNDLFPDGWESRITHVIESAGYLMMVVEVEVAGSVHAGTGAAEADKDKWGGAHAEAYSQAFRRACAHHGLGLYMYKDEEPTHVRPSDRRGHSRPDSPRVHSGTDPDGDSDVVSGNEATSGHQEEGDAGPTATQRERLTQLGDSGVFGEEELGKYRARVQDNWTKQGAGKVIREMKEEYEQRTGSPFQAPE